MTSFIARQHVQPHLPTSALPQEYASAESFFRTTTLPTSICIWHAGQSRWRESVNFAAFRINGPGSPWWPAMPVARPSTDKSRVRLDDFAIIKKLRHVPVACEPYVVDVPLISMAASPIRSRYRRRWMTGYSRVILILSAYVTQYQATKDLAPARILERSHPAAAEKLRTRYKTYNDELELARHYEAEGKVLILAPEDLYGLNT